MQFYTAADDTFVKCLSTGECVIAVGWLHDGLSALSADTSGDLHLIIPASGTFGQVTASAILSGASHTAAAQLWQEFVLSRPAPIWQRHTATIACPPSAAPTWSSAPA